MNFIVNSAKFMLKMQEICIIFFIDFFTCLINIINHRLRSTSINIEVFIILKIQFFKFLKEVWTIEMNFYRHIRIIIKV